MYSAIVVNGSDLDSVMILDYTQIYGNSRTKLFVVQALETSKHKVSYIVATDTCLSPIALNALVDVKLSCFS